MISLDSSAIFPWAIMRVVLPMGGATATAGEEAVGGTCVCVCQFMLLKLECAVSMRYSMYSGRKEKISKRESNPNLIYHVTY